MGLKYRIRKVLIKCSKEKAREKREKRFLINYWDYSKNLRREVLRITNRWESRGTWNFKNGNTTRSIYQHIAKGAIIRWKANWKLKALFAIIFSNDGLLITDRRRILQEIQLFYSNLCKCDPLDPSEGILNSFLNNPEIKNILITTFVLARESSRSTSAIRVLSFSKVTCHRGTMD